jgi:hypothetical protein
MPITPLYKAEMSKEQFRIDRTLSSKSEVYHSSAHDLPLLLQRQGMSKIPGEAVNNKRMRRRSERIERRE